jgi:hypothetical protein
MAITRVSPVTANNCLQCVPFPILLTLPLPPALSPSRLATLLSTSQVVGGSLQACLGLFALQGVHSKVTVLLEIAAANVESKKPNESEHEHHHEGSTP